MWPRIICHRLKHLATIVTESGSSANAKRNKDRRKLFLAIALLLPLLTLLLLEGLLRIAGFAPPEPLFVPVENAPEQYIQPNEKVIQRYFADPRLAPRTAIDTTFFPAQKSDDSFRIVLQGGSTAAGFPYGKWASPAGLLKQRLIRSFPDRDIELVSTAMSAVNSYTLADFAEEIVAIEPDAVLIYAGHNEYLGVLGVGSAFSSARSPSLTRLILWLQQWRLFRLIQKSFLSLSGALPDEGEEPPGTLMARIAAERAIAYGSREFEAGVAQFRHNMSGLLDTYRAAGIPVMIATIASNLRDQPPFSSGLEESTDPQRWQELLELASDQFEQGRLDEATATANALVELDDGSAEAHFLLARILESSGDTGAAGRHYAAAKDRDRLRFRAPEAINTVIRELASEYGAQLIDVEARLQAESPNGIVGSELMVEHLHPNVRGYFFLADAFYDAMHELGWIGVWSAAVDDAAAWETRSVTEIDRLGGEYRVMQLKSDWPFQPSKQAWSLPPPADEIEVIAQNWFLKRITWLDAMNQALAFYQRAGNIDEAVRVALNLADAFVFLDDAQYAAGQLLLRQGQPRLALRYLHAAARLQPREPTHLLALAQAFYQSGYREQSIETLRRLAEIEPDNPRTAELIERLESGLEPLPARTPQDP